MRAEEFLKSQFGFKVIYAPNSTINTGYIAGSAKQRADDLTWAFSNPEIKCIMSAIGGLNSNAMLPYINFDVIRKNPKVFVGYSDVTALHLPIVLLGNLISFYGPALFSEWGEFPKPFIKTIESFTILR